MSGHEDERLLIQAYADNELDAEQALRIESHLGGCADCRAELEAIRDLKHRMAEADWREDVPPNLRAHIRASLRRRPPVTWRLTLAGGLVAAGLAAALLVAPRLAPAGIAAELVASHVRSLTGDRLVDVASSAHDRVKPWFDTRIGFAPPVLATVDGCTLVGGRLDTVRRRMAAAMAYRCGGHVVSFYATADRTRSDSAPATIPQLASARGYQVVSWKRGRLDCYAVSDVPGPQLVGFARFIEAHAAEG